jgi:radical SAM superfamily enzyme YgiQ (UPF0313 family)
VFCDIPIFNEGKWRSRSPQHVIDEFRELQQQGYGAVYFVDDHFLLQPKRIEAICTGIVAAGVTIQWGCEGRVDSTAQHLFPNMAAAHCRTLMFGIESGSQAVLDRLKKEQTLAEVETAVTNAKQAGIKIVHGFFVVGTPGETVEDMRATFDFAARLRLDTFGFNRLCVYRGTPLWQEYVQRGLVDDTDDWYKYFKCSEIDPTCLPGAVINAERAAGLRRLFGYKLTHYPLQTLRLLRRFLRHMPVRDVLYLIVKPFLGSQQGPTTNEVLSRAVEHASVKDAAARLTQVPDAVLERVGTA